MEQNTDVAWALGDIAERAPVLKKRRDYYEGRHAQVLYDSKTVSPLLRGILEDLSDNMCADVVDEPASRLEITAWRSAGDDGKGQRGVLAQALWDANRGSAREGQTYRDMFALGDAFNIVEVAGDGKARWHPQAPEQMAVRYSTEYPDLVEVAAKVWRKGKGWRLNLYYGPTPGGEDEAPAPGRLERWATKGTGSQGGVPQARSFERVMEDERGEPDDGTRADWERNPVFHFPNAAVGTYGRSVLTDIIPLQDLLNKAISDLVVDMEEMALPQRWAIGVQHETDDEGRPKPIKRRSRSSADMLSLRAKPGEVELGQFDAADLAPFLAVQHSWRVEIARKGHLPLSSVDATGAAVASGLSLLVQEGRLVKRCKDTQRDAGWVWREQIAFMLTLMGTATDPDEVDMEWAPLSTRDERDLWETLTIKKDMGVPDRQVLVEGGYSPEEVDEWLEEADTMEGGRLSMPGPLPGAVASVTIPGVSGGMAVPTQPAGAAAPAVPANG